MVYSDEEIKVLRDLIVMEAKKILKVPFRHGGVTPSGLDCKGAVWLPYRKAGISHIPQGNGQYYPPEWFLHAEKNYYLEALLTYYNYTSNPQKGDLVIFATSRRRDFVNHAGIYVNQTKFIHARSGGKVEIEEFNDKWRNPKVFKGYLILKEFDKRQEVRECQPSVVA